MKEDYAQPLTCHTWAKEVSDHSCEWVLHSQQVLMVAVDTQRVQTELHKLCSIHRELYAPEVRCNSVGHCVRSCSRDAIFENRFKQYPNIIL